MFCVTLGQRSDVMAQVMTSWTWLIVITCIQCRVEAGAKNRCDGGVCSNHDNRMLAQYDQPISDAQVRYYIIRSSFLLLPSRIFSWLGSNVGEFQV